jgi:hypothetical protein
MLTVQTAVSLCSSIAQVDGKHTTNECLSACVHRVYRRIGVRNSRS